MEMNQVKILRRQKTCCFSGHRSIPVSEKARLAARLEQEMLRLIHIGVIYFGAGGALGFDTLAAQTVIRLRTHYPHIKLILVLPCQSQADRWSACDKRIYEEIKALANKTVYTSQEYTNYCMFKRNQHLVDNSGFCLCYQVKEHGGTAYTVRYAREQGLSVINLARQEVSYG